MGCIFLITFIHIITPLLTSTHKRVLAWDPSSSPNNARDTKTFFSFFRSGFSCHLRSLAWLIILLFRLVARSQSNTFHISLACTLHSYIVILFPGISILKTSPTVCSSSVLIICLYQFNPIVLVFATCQVHNFLLQT